jgi:geranylgeranyl reductase family protein
MAQSRPYDAIVVGAGPAGSATAALLAGHGFRVALLDRAAFPRDKACGEYTSPETEAVLARIGALEAVERAGTRRLHSMRVVSPNGSTVTIRYSSPGEPNGKQVLATTRRALDATLLDFARSRGVEVRERVKVEGVLTNDNHVAGVLAREAPGRGPFELPARLVVGADGIHSAIVRSLNIAVPVRWPVALGMVAHYTGYNGLHDWGEMHVSSEGYAGLAPQTGGIVNVGLVMPMSRAADHHPTSSADRFNRFALSFPGVAARLHNATRVSPVRGVGPIGARVRRTSGPGYLLVGDAAGFFDPFTGEGVYKALRGAELAAYVAADALARNDLTAPSLARYSALRRRQFTAKDMVCRLVQLIVTFPPVTDYVVTRMQRRARVRTVMAGVLGDYADPRAALTPAYLWSLLRP